MRNEISTLEVLDAIGKRREARRNFLRVAGASTVAVGGLSLLAACGDDTPTPVATPTPTPTTAVTDADVLNFALQLEYLEANYYSYAVFGTPISASLTAGVGTQGAVATSSSGGPRAVSFANEPVIGQYAREIAGDEIAHVTFLRAALGSAAAAQPAINLSGDANGAFTAAARAAMVVDSSTNFDPYSSPDTFLLGAFIFEDVGVTAYKGAAPLLTNKTYLEAAAGILAAEAYHAGLVRTILYNRGQSNSGLINAAGQISDRRDLLDGTVTDDTTRGIGADDDQGIASTGSGSTIATNLVPTNGNSLAYSRTTSQVLHIAYLTATANATGGGFFPNGVNGSIRTAA